MIKGEIRFDIEASDLGLTGSITDATLKWVTIELL